MLVHNPIFNPSQNHVPLFFFSLNNIINIYKCHLSFEGRGYTSYFFLKLQRCDRRRVGLFVCLFFPTVINFRIVVKANVI